MDRTTLTANLKPLERRSLLSIMPDAEDRRARRLTLTANGLALLEPAIPIWIATHEAIETEMAIDAHRLRGDLVALTAATAAKPGRVA